MINRIRSWAAGRILLVVRWWLTGRRAHKIRVVDGLEHHMGVGTFMGGFVSRDPETNAPDGLVMFWMPEWSSGVSDFEQIKLTSMHKHPIRNEVVFYVSS